MNTSMLYQSSNFIHVIVQMKTCFTDTSHAHANNIELNYARLLQPPDHLTAEKHDLSG